MAACASGGRFEAPSIDDRNLFGGVEREEIGPLGRARSTDPWGGGHDEKEQTLNQLLVELDGFEPRRARHSGGNEPAGNP